MIADGQRNQHPGVGRVGQLGEKTLAYPVAQTLDHVAGPPHEIVEARDLLPGTDRSRRPDAALKQPSFVVKTVRIGTAMRPFQPRRKTPAFARTHGARRRIRLVFLRLAVFYVTLHDAFQFIPRVIPREEDAPRHPGAGRQDFLDIEQETFAAFETLWQRGDNPDHFDVAHLPCRRQFVGQAHLRPPCRPAEPQRGTGQHHGGARPPGTAARPQPEAAHSRDQQAGHRQHRRQHSLLLQQEDARSKGEDA